MKEIKANTVIFDMDGVIIDSIPLHKKTYSEIFKKMNVPFSIEKFDEINGRHIEDAFNYIKENYGGNFNVNKAVKKKKEKNIEISKKAHLMKGTKKLIKILADKNFNLILATSATKKEAENVFKRFNLNQYFDCVITGEDVEHSKPNPEIFVSCIKKLNLNKKNSVVIEDSPKGIKAAKKAGMKCIALTSTHKKTQLNEADAVVENLNEISSILKFNNQKRKGG